MDIIDLALYVDNTLIVSDTHIGYEEALNKQGILIPRFQFKEIIKRLEKIFSILKENDKKVEKIIVNGDIKHEFGTISEQEWRHTLQLLDFLAKHCKEVILIKGNHDKIIGPIASKRNVKVVEHYIIAEQSDAGGPQIITKRLMSNSTRKINKKVSLKELSIKKIKKNDKNSSPSVLLIKGNKNQKILVMHGDKLPNDRLLKDIDVIIIGHEHPAVSISDWPRVELVKCFLKGKYKGKELIAQPSFNLVAEGTDVLKEKLLSPFLQQNIDDFEVYAVEDKVYNFGKVRDLR